MGIYYVPCAVLSLREEWRTRHRRYSHQANTLVGRLTSQWYNTGWEAGKQKLQGIHRGTLKPAVGLRRASWKKFCLGWVWHMGRSWPGDVEKEECFQRKGEERGQLSTAGGGVGWWVEGDETRGLGWGQVFQGLLSHFGHFRLTLRAMGGHGKF